MFLLHVAPYEKSDTLRIELTAYPRRRVTGTQLWIEQLSQVRLVRLGYVNVTRNSRIFQQYDIYHRDFSRGAISCFAPVSAAKVILISSGFYEFQQKINYGSRRRTHDFLSYQTSVPKARPCYDKYIQIEKSTFQAIQHLILAPMSIFLCRKFEKITAPCRHETARRIIAHGGQYLICIVVVT